MGHASFARHLRHQRIRKGLAQRDVARDAQIDRAYISRLESGERYPSRETVGALCGAMNLSPLDAERLYRSAGFVYNVNVAPLHLIVRDGLVNYEFDEDIIDYLDATWQSMVRLACATQEARNGVSGSHRVSD